MMLSPRLAPDSAVVRCAFGQNPAVAALAPTLHGSHLLLTGGTGFFGQWLLALLDNLVRRGVELQVSVVSRDPARFLAALPEYRQCHWLHWLASDVRHLPRWSGSRPNLLLHAATDTSAAAHAQPLELFDSIVAGSRRMLELAVECGTRRILFTGSGAQYGALPAGHPVVESSPLACDSTLAASAYAQAKRAQETLAAIYADQHGLEPVLTRCFAFGGPGLPQDGHFAIGNFVRDALFADAIELQSSGQAVRSYLHGADLAVWLLHLLCKGAPGEAYNVGSDHAITVADLALRVRDLIAPHKRVHVRGRSSGPHTYYVPDIGKARSLGLDTWTTLDRCIEDMASWARDMPHA